MPKWMSLDIVFPTNFASFKFFSQTQEYVTVFRMSTLLYIYIYIFIFSFIGDDIEIYGQAELDMSRQR